MTCYASTSKTLGLLLLSVLLIGASALCTILPTLPAQLLGWTGIAVFGLGFLLALRRLVQQEPLVIIDEQKIEDRRAGWRIPWQDVDTVRISRLPSSRCLSIEISDDAVHEVEAAGFGARLHQAMGRWLPGVSVSPVTIAFRELRPGLEAAWAHIQQLEPDRTP